MLDLLQERNNLILNRLSGNRLTAYEAQDLLEDRSIQNHCAASFQI